MSSEQLHFVGWASGVISLQCLDYLFCSGGELQRFAIAVVAAQSADIYMIDEPSSYLDVRQRLKAAQVFPFTNLLPSSLLGTQHAE